MEWWYIPIALAAFIAHALGQEQISKAFEWYDKTK